MKKFKTYAPAFTGFYETTWDIDTDDYRDTDGNVVEYDRLIIDFDGYKNEVGRRYCQELPDLFPAGMVGTIEYENIWSPREYNFKTNSINCTVEVDTDKLSKFLEDEWRAFKAYIKEGYTSYDGFISWHSNDAEEWKKETQGFTEFSDEAHKLGDILNFILSVEQTDPQDVMYMLVNPLECQDNYITCREYEWDEVSSEELAQAILDNEDTIDFEYGYGKILVDEAKHRASIFGTAWQGELLDETKIDFLSSVGITAEIIKNN